ncbi:hypothetical protein HE1_00883 [Holospora elegans E1]|uniref:Uncharacterized protein n=2 Tax=Holospora TaxID=44747 RepID=A0A023DZM7_9PROT|nr:hypothetical protein HE1_00883 [Holospora elegans E1]
MKKSIFLFMILVNTRTEATFSKNLKKEIKKVEAKSFITPQEKRTLLEKIYLKFEYFIKEVISKYRSEKQDLEYTKYVEKYFLNLFHMIIKGESLKKVETIISIFEQNEFFDDPAIKQVVEDFKIYQKEISSKVTITIKETELMETYILFKQSHLYGFDSKYFEEWSSAFSDFYEVIEKINNKEINFIVENYKNTSNSLNAIAVKTLMENKILEIKEDIKNADKVKEKLTDYVEENLKNENKGIFDNIKDKFKKLI